MEHVPDTPIDAAMLKRILKSIEEDIGLIFRHGSSPYPPPFDKASPVQISRGGITTTDPQTGSGVQIVGSRIIKDGVEL